MSPPENDSEDYFLPLTEQRIFGAGIKRKRVAFVPASTTTSNISSTAQPLPSNERAAARYLDIVFSKPKAEVELDRPKGAPNVDKDANTDLSLIHGSQVCPICSQPVDSQPTMHIQHKLSIRHQLSIPHVHPPSHLPRDHPGLKYLSSYGWDPDSRTGLGAQSQGIRQPVKAHEKRDTHGLREKLNAEDDHIPNSESARGANHDRSLVRLNAKQIRLQAIAEKKRTARIHDNFYSRIDVEEYLGSDG